MIKHFLCAFIRRVPHKGLRLPIKLLKNNNNNNKTKTRLPNRVDNSDYCCTHNIAASWIKFFVVGEIKSITWRQNEKENMF